ncbi:serine/arginine-rich splicing factor RS2Z33-like [Nylanderia fulva]|uniref:serine/arginine-rich splicing factor RS2Z33-like n=1 Tax=Nylanderia fulva TaxID=613905 RepID=UPI0010FBB249|nr:serine/arginine-rich splicing factor RS2Z33-like [Nylanderia fulva]XP_029164542.1 serine/arginine-rich splicing factor RS2Z33-like [Nylanderia fulva]XP_029172211.1 serine/arginine-rich splicing factor RS2Z33-like [Nylanderia fulva]
MGNRVPVDEDELLEHIIDGIPDDTLRDQARIQGFSSTDLLLRAFSKIILRNRNVTGADRQDRRDAGPARGERRERIVESGDWSGRGGGDGRRGTPGAERCFNCGAREHISANCPTKNFGSKCFECGKHGHIALKCPKKMVN